jgi:hypothetical protein
MNSSSFVCLKGQSHEIFDPRFFSANNTPGSPDSWAKAVLNKNSYSRRYFIFEFDSALCGTARSRLRAMLHSTESIQIRNISAKTKPNSKIF